ncbi:MAG TPA: DUF6544 family protein [Chryseolinea sp.]|nr:DUF6544 family protein [Chryseolinea sp.]
MTILVFILAFIASSVAAVLVGKAILNRKFQGQSDLLLAQTKDISAKIFHSYQLKGLPQSVQRYFKLVLKDGQPYISNVSFTHNGQFKTGLDKGWINITGKHFATMDKPGFIWMGTTSLFTARDMFIEDKGRLVVALFSLYKIVDAKGESYNQGELLRWLGESVLYPTNLLPSERLEWSAIDYQHSKLIFTYNGISLPFAITFNEAGEITQMETKRYMDEKNLETWVINATDYKSVNDVRIPSRFEVLWRLEKGDFTYAKFNIQQITYNEAAFLALKV